MIDASIGAAGMAATAAAPIASVSASRLVMPVIASSLPFQMRRLAAQKLVNPRLDLPVFVAVAQVPALAVRAPIAIERCVLDPLHGNDGRYAGWMPDLSCLAHALLLFLGQAVAVSVVGVEYPLTRMPCWAVVAGELFDVEHAGDLGA